jgi:hypothetical protein
MTRTMEPPPVRPTSAARRLTRIGLVAAVLVLSGALAAACGGGTDPSASTGTGGQPSANQPSASQSGVKFATCMRANGVPNFPDTAVSDTGGRVEFKAPPGVDTTSAPFKSAMQACRKDLPGGGSGSGSSSGSNTQQVIKFANCMRANGVPNFPEPNAQGAEVITGGGGVTPTSPQYKSAMQTCQHLLPAGAVGG